MINFKKVMAVGSSILLAGMSVVAAASYPKPFVDGSTANVAIVYGTGAGVSALDKVSAGNIQTSLESSMTGTGSGSSVTGESYKFEKTSTKFHLGDTMSGFKTTLQDTELPVLLAEGKYTDDDNDEFDYTQKITLGASQLTLFDENDYARDSPTVGFAIAKNAHVLNYTLDFSDEPLVADIETTDMPMMGRTYYVLDQTDTSYGLKLTLLDSAEDTILAEDESATLNVEGTTYDVAIEFISSSEVKLDVNGELTTSLAEGQTYKLDDGSYIGVKDILYTAKDTGISKVEFSIGNGKLIIENGREVELNEEAVDELYGYIVNSSTALQEITLKWNSEELDFVTEDMEVIMPGFEAIKLSYGGLTYPAEESIKVEAGGDDYLVLNDFPLKDSTEDIAILYGASGAFTGIGKDADEKLATSTGNVTFDADTDEYFVATYINGDDAESYLMRATNFEDNSGTNKTTFQYRNSGSWTDAQTNAQAGDTFSIGSVDLKVGVINVSEEYVVVETESSSVNFHTLVSAEGMKVYLPYDSTAAGSPEGSINLTNTSIDTFALVFEEEDSNDNIAGGDQINLTLGWNGLSPNEVHVTDVVGEDSSLYEIGESNVERAFMYSALATEILRDTDPSQDTVELIYHGSEVAADAYIAAPDATVSTGSGSLGEVLVMDSEVSSVSSKNLVIVGGSCINSAAATVLGGAYCGAAFTDATGVGPGQFLIKGVSGAYSSGKIALVVAGYDAADTVAATSYLTTQTVDTDKEYLGTSATNAEIVVA
jgi:hypothetical protein